MGNDNQLLLLHLSDIHFREPYCLNPETDSDYPVRIALLNDIRRMVKKLGPVSAILISGDIAFKAHEYEYRAATEWLNHVLKEARCPKRGIYTVPGNHDVNRATADGKRLQGIRGQISECTAPYDRDKKFHDTVLDYLTIATMRAFITFRSFVAVLSLVVFLAFHQLQFVPQESFYTSHHCLLEECISHYFS